MLVKNVCEYLDNKFPYEDAVDSDFPRIGLIIGDENIEVNNILLTLDLNYEVVNKAIEKDCNLIIAHHPFIFEPIYKILFNSEKGKIINLMFKHQISLYVMHTNLDVGVDGVNEVLISLLTPSSKKVERKDLLDIGLNDEEIDLIFGLYKEAPETTFYNRGDLKNKFLKTVYLDTTLGELIELVKEKFALSGVRYLGDLNKKISKVGIVGGSGGSISSIVDAINAECDCYITGEIRLNCSQFAEEKGLALIEVNHGVEKFVFEKLKENLSRALKNKFDFENVIYANLCETDNMKIK